MGRRHARASRGRDTVDCGAPSRPRRFPAGARSNGRARPRANDRATARRLTMRCCSEPRVCFARRGKPPAMKEELRIDGPEPAVVEEDREVRQQCAARPELEIVRREHTRDRRERGGAARGPPGRRPPARSSCRQSGKRVEPAYARASSLGVRAPPQKNNAPSRTAKIHLLFPPPSGRAWQHVGTTATAKPPQIRPDNARRRTWKK